MGVGDVARHDAPGRPEHADIVGVAETDDDIRNEVCRHDEIRECGYDSGLYTDRRFRILGTVIGGDGFLCEGDCARCTAELAPEFARHYAFIRRHTCRIETGYVLAGHQSYMGSAAGLCYTVVKFDANREMRMDAKGLPAIVTGGGSGLGAGAARALASAGAKVAVLDINKAAAEEVAAKIGGSAFECDVSDAASGEAAVTAAREAHGPAAICVNCAGIGTPGRIVGREGPMDLDQFSRVINVNLIGTFNIMRLAVADMMTREANDEGERGLVVNTASVAAYEGQIGQAAYSASKGGVVGMTLPAAREFARAGVRVLAIAPGLFATPMLMGLPENVQQSLAANLPFPSRFGRPAEYASLVMHMVSNPVLNGEVIRLDSAIRLAPT